MKLEQRCIIILTDTWRHIFSKVHDDIFTINTGLSFMGLLLIIYFSCFHHMRNKTNKKETPKNKKPSKLGTAICGLLGRRGRMLTLRLWFFSSMDFRVLGAEIPDYRASLNPQRGYLYATRLVPIVSIKKIRF